jgi:hypothetical protein
MKFNFNVKKAAQAAGFLLELNSGGMDQFFLIKMLYLAA